LNDVFLYDDSLLGCRLQNVIVQRDYAKALNRVCNSWFLRNEGLSQRRRPIRMLSHHVEDVWVMSDRLYADIPILTFNQILIHLAA
jgi:hypothetical protein